MVSELAIKTATGPTILLQSGHYFDLLDPWHSQFTIEDIAHGLSHCCRFAGQCDRFYSVAEHSVFVSDMVPIEHAYAGLMHDAAEAFIGDVTRPLKALLPAFKEIERSIEAAVFERFAVPPTDNGIIKQADLRALAAEQQLMMPPHDDSWACLAGIEPPEMQWSVGLNPARAKSLFLERYRALRPSL